MIFLNTQPSRSPEPEPQRPSIPPDCPAASLPGWPGALPLRSLLLFPLPNRCVQPRGCSPQCSLCLELIPRMSRCSVLHLLGSPSERPSLTDAVNPWRVVLGELPPRVSSLADTPVVRSLVLFLKEHLTPGECSAP